MVMSMADERVRPLEGDFGSQSEEKSRSETRSGKAVEKGKPERSPAVRTLLWILRKSIVPLIMVVMLAAGLYVGYTVVGNGASGDVYHWSTWKHLYDLVFSDS